MPADIDIPSIRQQLHDSRHSESAMADWARRHGAELCDAAAPRMADYRDCLELAGRIASSVECYEGDDLLGQIIPHLKPIIGELETLRELLKENPPVVSDEIVLPEPNHEMRSATPDSYQFPDGSFVRKSFREKPGFWYVKLPSGHVLRDESGSLQFFSTPLEAAAKALRDAAKGAGRKE